MNPIADLHALGQSLWYDNIQRSLLTEGVLARLIEAGDIRGVTSNPTIFNNAISKSHDYDEALVSLARSGMDAEGIFYRLAIEDIQAAADLFMPLYRDTNGGDGYVSLEVNPFLAADTQKTIEEAKKLWAAVARPNLMVKIPATPEGIPAITEAIAAGIHVNVTLIFSLRRYAEVIEAYLRGLENRVAEGLAIDRVASVASFFVSRMDTKVDARLEAIAQSGGPQASKVASLAGKAGIANAKLAYALFEQVFRGERFRKLERLGARVQRPLWASTSTKNPRYSDVMYVEELIGPQTVNTVPPQTLDAFRDHGRAHLSITEGVDEARQTLADLEDLGISIDQVTKELESEGVKAFSDSFAALLRTIEERRLAIQAA